MNTEPVYLTVKTNYKDTGLFVNGKRSSQQKRKLREKIGPFVPGTYEVKAKLKSGIADLEKGKGHRPPR
ncbi:hypothetical protein PO124_11160 [Bacillus licheniformis]|nr:hypothetical protein [Bacillus licheniformis]